ncbi:MAG: glycosyltransferase family 2 protein [Candidatus Woesearchaeota archaeon]
MTKLSVFIIAKNEEEKIENALKSIKKIADEIILIDDFSTDKTTSIAKRYGAKIFRKKLKSFATQKNLAISKCKNEWVLELDSDEVLPEKTATEIIQVLKNPKFDGYYLYRDEFFLGKKIFSVKKLRLYKKSFAKYFGIVHEELEFKGTVGMLSNHFIHEQYKYESVSYFIQKKINYYSDLEIKKIEQNNLKLSRAKTIWLMFYEPIKYFFGLLFYKGAVRAGFVGIMYAYLFAFYRFLIYLKYYEKFYVNPNP